LALNVAMHLGAVCFNAQKFGEAATSFRFVINRDAPAGMKADAMYNLAVALKKDHDFNGALKAWEAFTGAYPQDSRQIDALLETSAIYETLRLPESAVKIYEQLLDDKRVAPAKKQTLYARMGEIAVESGNKDKAMEAYTHLLTMAPLSADARLSGLAQLAAMYEEKEDWQNALTVYRQIAQSRGRADWVKAAVKRNKEIQKYLNSLRAQKTAPQPDPTQQQSATGE
jgi:tetratricopeptide (TPR) repeat protein